MKNNMRKALKQRAKGSLKRHYAIFVIICLLAAILGSEFSTSMLAERAMEFEEEQYYADMDDSSLDGGEYAEDVEYGDGVYDEDVEPYDEEVSDMQALTETFESEYERAGMGAGVIRERFMEILANMSFGLEEESRQIASSVIEENVQKTKENQKMILGRSRGILSAVVNSVTSGSVVISMVVGVRSIVGSNSVAVMILILLSMLAIGLGWVFFINIYQSVMRRMFLEGRLYEKLHLQRALFFLRVKKWIHVGLALLKVTLIRYLWWLTIVGGAIKHFSYFLAPFILAENPGLTGREALRLSKKLMRGHKWECFVLRLSFLPWDMLCILTLGLSDIFYTNPYRMAVYSEYYAHMRALGKKAGVEGAELLTDDCLFERANQEKLTAAYGDVVKAMEKPSPELPEWKGIRGFLANVFGLTLFNDARERDYEEAQAQRIRLGRAELEYNGRMYPTRLSPIPEKQKRRWVCNLHYVRHYSLMSIVMIFFILSLVGWLWEVSLHLVSDGVFVNRGVLHGPWLPIYGSGGVMILLLLNRFRKKPLIEFAIAIVLCGCVEYFTSYYLEMTHNGMKWWDYSGYFLNLNGRICAEGLLVFGLGGMAIVYLLAPVLDNFIRRIPTKALAVICLVLVCAFCADQAYSKKHPNAGKGITDYKGAWIVEMENQRQV